MQTLVGAWPLDAERLGDYLEKALREAKVNTTWVDQDHDWEAGRRPTRPACSSTSGSADFEPFAAARAERASGPRSAHVC